MPEMRPLGDLLPEAGLQVVVGFQRQLAAGAYAGREYLDIHADLRERLRPFEQVLAERGMTDLDFFVLVLLTRLGVKGGGGFLRGD